jgi:hypothetical protein
VFVESGLELRGARPEHPPAIHSIWMQAVSRHLPLFCAADAPYPASASQTGAVIKGFEMIHGTSELPPLLARAGLVEMTVHQMNSGRRSPAHPPTLGGKARGNW